MGNPFAAPKMPKPVVVEPPKEVPNEKALSEERLRRARSTGSAGNILSDLSVATPDAAVGTKRSSLLGG